MSENQNQPTVITDKQDYSPGSTAVISTAGFSSGSTIQFSAQIINPGADGIIGTADDFLGSAYTWLATDGAAPSDRDGAADGSVTTLFYVAPEYANTTILLTATEVSVGADGAVTQTGPSATHVFTDAVGIPTAISGYVYHDKNNDGIFQHGIEDGIAGVAITLTGMDWSTADGSPVNITVFTDANGFYEFTDLDEVYLGPFATEGYTLTETQPGGWIDGKDTIGTPGGTTTNDQFSHIILLADEPGFNNNFGELLAGIHIEKVTVDAPLSGDGLTILSGEPISWVYTVTNTGDVALSNVHVTDSEAGVTPVYQSGDTNNDSKLGLTETWIFSAPGTAVLGPYTNTGYVSGTYTDAYQTHTVTDQDVSDYVGITPVITINKVTVDAPAEGDGLTILSGESISWKYSVTNGGGEDLHNVVVTDSESGVTPTYVSGDDGDNILEDGETWIYSASGTSIEGAYNNTGTAIGSITDDAGHTRTATATDVSNYTGIAPHIAINKVTKDAGAEGDGLTILAGESISWKYSVTNTGTAALSNVTVTDNQPGVSPVYQSGDDGDGLLEVGETWIYSASGTSIEGAYNNTGTAKGSVSDTAGHSSTATATDVSNYTGIAPHIAINKITIDNGAPGASGDGITILSGESISWKYSVTNTGTAALSNVTVTDNQPGVSPVYQSGDDGDGLLEVGETWIYKANGTAIEGSYNNTGKATGKVTDTAGHSSTATATDDSSYVGIAPHIDIDKVTVYGANSGDGLIIPVGQPISWKYTVTNTGTVELSNVQVTDNHVGVTPVYQSGDTDNDGKLDVTETWIYLASGTSIAGSYTNTGTAKGSVSDTAGHTRTDTATDDSNYTGQVQPGSIGDTVFCDANSNGKFDAGEGTVAGVTVKLLNTSGTVLATTTTNASGQYSFTNLTPGQYVVQFVAPAGHGFSTQDVGGNAFDTIDSDANTSTGKTGIITVGSGQNITTVDAGITPISTIFDFSGNTALSGSFGNIMNFSSAGINVHVSAFSDNRSTGVWETAYLGSYSGGLGVTDRGEGTGANNTHTVDNNGGRDNYILFEFDKIVTLDQAFLGYVVGDSDMKVWIGNFTNAYSNHMTLSDSVLASMGFTELNSGAGSTRWADLNSGNFAGNVIVIAANTATSDTNDYFKVQKLDLDSLACAELLLARLGDRVWLDTDKDGQQDAGELGVAGVTVKLLNGGGTVIGTTTTDANGGYSFINLNAGSYQVQFVAPTGYNFTGQNVGNDASDSDANGTTGLTQIVTLAAGENNPTLDAGLVAKPKLTIDKTDCWTDTNCDGLADAGDVITYTVKVTNTGTSTISGINVTDPNVKGTTPLNGSTALSLAGGASKTYTFTYTIKQADIDSNSSSFDGAADGKLTNTAIATYGTESVSDTATTDISYCPDLEVEKMVSVDGGVNWYFTNSQGISNSSLISLVSQATGIATTKLHVGKPEVMAGATVQFKIVVANIGDVTEKNITAKDAADDPVLNGASFKFAGSTTIASLAPGAVKVSDTLTTTALYGTHTDTVTVKGTIGTSTTVLTLDSDTAAYTGTFQADCNAHNTAYWASCQSSWDKAIVNNVKGILLGDYAGTAWLGGSTTSTPKNMTSVAAGLFFIPEAAAIQILNYGASSSDVRQQMLAQAIAAQLNIDDGVNDPGYYPSTNPSGHDLIGEAVKWLTGASPFGTGGDVDANNNRILDTGTSGSIDYNTNTKALTASSSGAATAWSTYVDPNTTVKTGDIKVNGQDVKNALAAFNAGQLVTSMAGNQVGWNGSAGPEDVKLNNPDVFWSVLKENGVIAGPLQA